MSSVDMAIDLFLVLTLLITVWLLLSSADFLRAAVLFIAFGLFMSLAWVRMLAPDIALAEAAIGAGITGVLLMDAIRHMEWEKKEWGKRWPKYDRAVVRRNSLWQRGLPVAAMLALAGLLVAGILQLADQRPGLAELVAEEMETLEHPVTAVLLVFRSLDTWLELGILFLAVLGMLTVRGSQGLAAASLLPLQNPVLESVVRVLTPLAVLYAAYLIWLGTFTAGGAFQSGVVLGATGILLWLSGHASIDALPKWAWKSLVILGLILFTITAAVTALLPEGMFHYPAALKHAWISILEIAAAVSIGACFTVLFIGLHPSRGAFASAADSNKEDG